MRNYIQIIETLFRDPQLAKTQFNIYTTAQDHPAVLELLKRKGVKAHETPAKSKIGKITLTIEGTNYLYDEIDRALKMAALSGTNLSVFRAPRAGDEIKESATDDRLEKIRAIVATKPKYDAKTVRIADSGLVYAFLDAQWCNRNNALQTVEHCLGHMDQILTESPRPWDSLAGMKDGVTCTCSNFQLGNVGCECEAEQNLPVACKTCNEWLRTQPEVEARVCKNCESHSEGI